LPAKRMGSTCSGFLPNPARKLGGGQYAPDFSTLFFNFMGSISAGLSQKTTV